MCVNKSCHVHVKGLLFRIVKFSHTLTSIDVQECHVIGNIKERKKNFEEVQDCFCGFN
jgi:hypothetical protein